MHYACRHTFTHRANIQRGGEGECIDAQVNQRAIVYVGHNARRASLILFKFWFSHPSSDLSLFSSYSLYGFSFVLCIFYIYIFFFFFVASTLDVSFFSFSFSLFFCVRPKRTLESATKGIFQITSAEIYVIFFGRRGGMERVREEREA